MFLELSFASPTKDKKEVLASRSWGSDHDDKQEMSVDELISDFHKSATNCPKPNDNLSPSSPVPKYSKAKKRSGFAGPTRALKPDPVKTKLNRLLVKKTKRNDSSDDDRVVSPMPRIDYALKNRPSLVGRRRTPARNPTSLRSTMQRRRSPVLSSRSLTPPSLSPVTSFSITLSGSENTHEPITLDTDSLIRKEIRDLNDLISTSSRFKASDEEKSAGLSSVSRQGTILGKAKGLRSSLRLQVPNVKSKPVAPESPPPPPPPEKSEDDTDDSFAEEIRQLRASWRCNSLLTKELKQETKIEEDEPEAFDGCIMTALEVRNASNTIHELLHEAFKPFEERLKEEKAEAKNNKTISGITDSLELQSATRTIVSQLDVAFADMAERQKDDLKADKDAALAAKVAEAKDKEIAEERRKSDENDARARQMEILRLLPMHGKLLTCSADIAVVMDQLESVDMSWNREDALEAEIRVLRTNTHCKIQEIEARMLAAEMQKYDVSLNMTDWVRENSDSKSQMRPENAEIVPGSDIDAEPAGNDGTFEEILQRQVVENLNLTMLRLRHVLEIDAKEAAELKETQDREREEQEKNQMLQQKEDEQKEREVRDAECARQRVLGLSTIDDVDGWMDEGRRLEKRFDHDRPLNRLLASMENSMKVEKEGMLPFEIPDIFAQEDGGILYRSSPALNTQIHDGNGSLECSRSERRKGEKRHQRETRKREHQFGRTEGTSCVDGGSNIDKSSFVVDVYHKHHFNPVSNHWTSAISPPRRPKVFLSTSYKRNEKNTQNDDERVLPKVKKSKRKKGAMESKRKVNNLIQALQAERRRKTIWIQSCLCEP